MKEHILDFEQIIKINQNWTNKMDGGYRKKGPRHIVHNIPSYVPRPHP